MASALVERMASSQHAFVSLDDGNQHMSVDDLCVSVKSISLTESSLVDQEGHEGHESAQPVLKTSLTDRTDSVVTDKYIPSHTNPSPVLSDSGITVEQVLKDKHHLVDAVDKDEDEDEMRLANKQLPKLVRKLDLCQITTAQQWTDDASMTSVEKYDGEGKEDVDIKQGLAKENEDKEGLSTAGVDKEEITGSAVQKEEGSQVLRHGIPQEHDETSDDGIQESEETGSRLVPRGPIGGVAVYPEYPDVFQLGCFPVGNNYGDENPPKYRRPPPGYVPPTTYIDLSTVASPQMMNGGNVLMNGQGFVQPVVGFHGAQPLPIAPQDNDTDILIHDFMNMPANHSDFVSSDYDDILNSGGMQSENPPVLHTQLASYTHQSVVPSSTYPENTLSPISAAVYASSVVDSPTSDRFSEVLSPMSVVLSPENPTGCTCDVLSPTSTADSGLEDDLDFIIEFIHDDLERDRQRRASGPGHQTTPTEQPAIGNPNFGNPRFGNPYPYNGNQTSHILAEADLRIQGVTGIPPIVQLMPPSTLSPMATAAGPVLQAPVTCIVVSNVAPEPLPTMAAQQTPRFRPIRPKPPDFQQNAFVSPVPANSAAGTRGLPFIPQPEPEPTPVTEDSDKRMKIYRKVSGLTTEQIMSQDDDGDTILHVMVVRHDVAVVEALIRRLQRDGILHQALSIRNFQHQTPLCLAVIADVSSLVRRLIAAGSDVNCELQRTQLNNLGVTCYRLIHCVAKKGLEWSHTLDALLDAPGIQLDLPDSEGCSALHCAIDMHDRVIHKSKIDSRRTIYQLINRGANMAVKHSLNGKTPLHFVVEKKDADFLYWFLSLVHHFTEIRQQVSSSLPENPIENPRSLSATRLVRDIVNTPASNGATALHIAASLKMEPSSEQHKRRILQLLLTNGAEFCSRADSKLRAELSKDPALRELVKNAPNSNHHRS